VLLLALVPVLAAIGLARKMPVVEIVAGSLVMLVMAVVGIVARNQLVAAGAVSLGLVTAAGILVRQLGGSPESFFVFFLALVAISFYQETGLLLVGLVYVAGFHVFTLVSLYRESVIFRAGVIDLPMPVVAVTLDVLLVLLLIAGWRLGGRAEIRRGAGDDMFRIGFERSTVGMATLTPSGDFILGNRALTDTLGPVGGANVRSVVHADDIDELGRLWEAMGQAPNRNAERWLRFRTADGRAIWGKASLSFFRATADRPALILFQIEDSATGHLDQSHLESELAAKDEFVAAITEDLREPIRAVLDLTTRAAGDPIDLQAVVGRIDHETRHVASIVEDLLVSARPGATPVVPRSVDAGLLCRQALADVPGAAHVRVEGGDEHLWADPGLTVRILDHIVANAVRYGGQVVSLEVVGSGPDTVISVIDDGPAIPLPERERMFDSDLRGGSTPTRPAAVGLSLTVSRRLANQMDGELTYRRTSDGRNVFELRLPAEPVRATLDSDIELEPIRIPA
jgi:PAS domain S-box-containing protein